MGIRVIRLTQMVDDLSFIVADHITQDNASIESFNDLICKLICNKKWTASEVIKVFQLSGTPFEAYTRTHVLYYGHGVM